MVGAIIGDIVGSRFEFNNYRSKDFNLLTDDCTFTDDSVMSLAIAKAIMEHMDTGIALSKEAVSYMQTIGRKYSSCGFGGRFFLWILSDTPSPCSSYGNGSAMRVSACALAADSKEQALQMCDEVTKVSHNHPEGIKGARAVTEAIYLAKAGESIANIKKYICENYYNIDFTIDEIRSEYKFNATCQGSVPQALEAFFESTSFEDTLRTAISLGGDSDTIAAIACSIAQAYYGVPRKIYDEVIKYLDDNLKSILFEFENRFGTCVVD